MHSLVALAGVSAKQDGMGGWFHTGRCCIQVNHTAYVVTRMSVFMSANV